MIEVVHMPFESTKFSSVLDSIDLRRKAFLNQETWIGQSSERDGAIDDFDHDNSLHIINRDKGIPVGYARLVPMVDGDSATVSGTIADLARQSNRRPALEVQCVSFADESHDSDLSKEAVLRELFIKIMRVSNNRQCRFVYTTSDRRGTAIIKKIGLRYSTLSTPFPLHGRLMVVLCIAVTNSNILALNPFNVVGGTQAQTKLQGDVATFSPAAPAEFGQLEAISNFMGQSDDPIHPKED